MYTEQLQNVYTYAKKYAQTYSTFVHSGHYLDGLLSVESSIKDMLNQFGITRDIFKEANYGSSASANEAETVRLKTSAISNQLNSSDCGCEHLLLAILSISTCYAYKFLQYNMPQGKKMAELIAFVSSKIPELKISKPQTQQTPAVTMEKPAQSRFSLGQRSVVAQPSHFQTQPQQTWVSSQPHAQQVQPIIQPQTVQQPIEPPATQQVRQQAAPQAVEQQQQPPSQKPIFQKVQPQLEPVTEYQPQIQYQPTPEPQPQDQQLLYCTDLTQKAREGKFDPIIGREAEVNRVIQSLSRRTKNNPVLIGEAGVGKSAIIEGLAQAIVMHEVPVELMHKRILELDIAGMLAGSRYRGDFEERFKTVLANVIQSDDVILFIDEIHNLVGTGSSAEKSIDAAEMLKPMLARGAIRLVGATTIDEYRKYIEKDSALERRFQPVLVDQPTEEQAIAIIKGVKTKYEQHHKVIIRDEAVESAVEMSVRYIADRFLPDKAFDVLDEACSMAKLEYYNEQVELYNSHTDAKIIITPEHIATVVSQWTGVPLKQLCQSDKEKLLSLDATLAKRVVGQVEAVKSVSNAIRRARTGLKDPARPIGSFIFVGPTGVGKTELSKVLAECLFGSAENLIRLDMSEYMEKQSTSKLIGAPPGYVGFEEGGQLTDKVRIKPYSVVLFDEIEKAHPDVFNLLLQILDEGRITDSRGKVIDFRNTVIIMTSNLGWTYSVAGQAKLNYEVAKSNTFQSLKQHFRPEFLNRVDDIVVFEPLTLEQTSKITTLLCLNLAKRLKGSIFLYFTPNAITYLTQTGFDAEYGARPLKRNIQKKVEDVLADKLLKGEVMKGDKVTVTMLNGELYFYVE